MPDEGNGVKEIVGKPSAKSGSGTGTLQVYRTPEMYRTGFSDLNSWLSGMTGMSYESFQTPGVSTVL